MDKIKLVCINNKNYDWLVIGDIYEVKKYNPSDIYIIVPYRVIEGAKVARICRD
jgi:hypothetical protein